MGLSLLGFLCILATMPSAEGRTRLSRWVVSNERMPPRGYQKLSITINGQTPGPTISAYQGDMLVIEVTNGLRKEDLAIQFDGVRPSGKAWTDPIRPGETFAYQFFVDQLGDWQYRASSTLQKEAGLYGLIRVSLADVDEGVPSEDGGAGQAGKLPRLVKGAGEIKGP